MKLIDFISGEYFIEDNLTINEVYNLYREIIPEDKENTILKMFDLIDKYMNNYGYNDEVVEEYQNNIIGLLYNRYDFSLSKINIDDKILEDLINTYANLRYSLYHKIIEFGYKASAGKEIDRKKYKFILYALTSFNLESMYYSYIISKNVRSINFEIKLMNLVVDYLYSNIKDDDMDVLDAFDFNYHRNDMVSIIKEDCSENVKVLKKK